MKKTLLCILCLALTFLMVGCGKDTSKEEENMNKQDNYLTGLHYVKMEIENYGDIELELDADVAPITVTNFINLVNENFYDGLTFHRVVKGFMIQGGDPDGNGTGGSPNTIKGEFAYNGVNNTISHKRGVISMARSQSYDSASSQFFICHEDSTFLDGKYAAFGHVTKGLDVVDKIAEETITEDDGETVAPKNQPKITRITVINKD